MLFKMLLLEYNHYKVLFEEFHVDQNILPNLLFSVINSKGKGVAMISIIATYFSAIYGKFI